MSHDYDYGYGCVKSSSCGTVMTTLKSDADDCLRIDFWKTNIFVVWKQASVGPGILKGIYEPCRDGCLSYPGEVVSVGKRLHEETSTSSWISTSS